MAHKEREWDSVKGKIINLASFNILEALTGSSMILNVRRNICFRACLCIEKLLYSHLWVLMQSQHYCRLITRWEANWIIPVQFHSNNASPGITELEDKIKKSYPGKTLVPGEKLYVDQTFSTWDLRSLIGAYFTFFSFRKINGRKQTWMKILVLKVTLIFEKAFFGSHC